jgi:transposase-like protein
MEQQQIIREIEHRAWEERVSISFLCQRAGIHPTTFWKWKKSARNTNPGGASLTSLNKLYDALDQIAAENKRRLTRKAVAA